MKRIAAALALVLCVAGFAAADIYIKSKTHSDPISIMGQNQPATDTISEQWLGNDKFALISEGMSSIIDLAKKTGAMVMHGSKSYVEFALPLDIAKLMPAEVASMVAGMMKMTVAVQANGQTRKIGTWNCQGYDVTLTTAMMPLKMSVWATKDVPFDLNKYMAEAYGNMLAAQLNLDEAAIREMKKVDGLWILTETNAEMMGAKIHSTSEVVEISNKPAPAGTYQVPAGYTKQTSLSMQDFQNMRR